LENVTVTWPPGPTVVVVADKVAMGNAGVGVGVGAGVGAGVGVGVGVGVGEPEVTTMKFTGP